MRCAMLGLGWVMLLPDGCAGVGARLPVPTLPCENPGEPAVAPPTPFGAPGGSMPLRMCGCEYMFGGMPALTIGPGPGYGTVAPPGC